MERNEIIVQLFHQSLSFRAIGREVGLSRTTVKRILVKVELLRITSRSRTCSYPGCNEPHYGKGFCRACFRVYEARKKCTRKNKRLCSSGGCGRIHFGRGYCKPHYYQIYRYGYSKPKPIRVMIAGRTCTFAVCKNDYHGNGYCTGHLHQLDREEKLHALRPKKKSLSRAA